MFTVTKRLEVSASHQLKLDYPSKCQNLHGHNWIITVLSLIHICNPETTTGGRAWKFYSSVRLDVRKGELIKANNENVGARTKVKVVKNKVAPPFKTAEFDLMYGEGISKTGTLIDIGTNMEIINKSGAWYSYNEMCIRDRSRARLCL